MQGGITYCFGDFEVQADEQRVLLRGLPIPLGARAFGLLLALLQRAGQLVTKDELLESVWPDVVVEENNLHVQISTLRKLLGADAIVTVVGRGYRFTPEICLKTPAVAHKQQRSTLTRSNLPHHLGALIGRTHDLDQLESLLKCQRLITVTGPGGVGKTRLMIACAQRVEAQFDAGVWLVELASQSDPLMVAVAVAARFGVEVKDATSATDALSRHLRDKDCLLLFDNCEHLVDAVASLVESILIASPGLRVMTTSQDVLGISGEQVYRVPCLPLPPANELDASTAMGFGAIRLFVERAKSGDPHFECDVARVQSIVSICRRLDGIPLAIEMAAARVSTLGLQSIARLLDERFLALAAGRRTAIPRQRTLQATLDWSYNLLAEREQVVLRRLAGFVGGFTLAAAIAVATDEKLSRSEVIESVSLLVAKSLLSVDASQDHWRYGLLEVTRAYALDRLAESGENDAVAQRAAEYFVATFGSCFDDWIGLADQAFEIRYAPDFENLRLAVEWSFSSPARARLAIELVGLSASLWIGRLVIAEAERWLSRAFALLEDATPTWMKAHIQLSAGAFYYWRLSDQAISILEDAAASYQVIADHRRAGYALLLLAHTQAAVGNPVAEQTILSAQSLLSECTSARLLTLLPKTWSTIHYMRGKHAETIRSNTAALKLAKSGGYEVLALMIEENLADSLWLTGDLAAALDAARNVVANCHRVTVPHKIPWGWIYGNLFGILTECDKLEEALEIGRTAMHYLREAKMPWIIMDHYALHRAKLGDLISATEVHGWADSYFSLHGIARQPNETRAREGLLAILRVQLSEQALVKHKSRGASLSENDVCRLAIGE